MGRFLNDQEIIAKNVEQYIEKSSSQYSRFLGSTPVFVTYYARDRISSTYDKGLEDVEKDLGRDSPNKFHKIENFPMYGIEQLSHDITREDYGLNTTYEGEGIILPNSQTPRPNDFFTIDYIGGIYLFKIRDIENDAIKQQPYYKVEFYFWKMLENESYIDDFISEEFTFLFDNIGSSEKPIVAKSDFITVDYIDKTYNTIKDYYVKAFFDRKTNLFLYRKRGFEPMYDRFANHFIMEHRLLEEKREFMSSIYLKDPYPKDIDFYELYKHTIFYVAEKGEVRETPVCRYGINMEFDNSKSVFLQYRDVYKNMGYTDVKSEHSFNLYPPKFIEFLILDMDIIKGDKHKFWNMLKELLLNKRAITHEDLDLIDREFDLEPSMLNWHLSPIILFILKRERNTILRTLS